MVKKSGESGESGEIEKWRNFCQKWRNLYIWYGVLSWNSHWQYCNFTFRLESRNTCFAHLLFNRLTFVRPFLCYLHRLVNNHLTAFCYSFSNFGVHHWQVTDRSIAFCSPFLILYRHQRVTDRLIDFVEICLPFLISSFYWYHQLVADWWMAFCLQYYLFHALAGGLFHFKKSPSYVLCFLSSEHRFDWMIILFIVIVATSLEGPFTTS